MHLGKYKELVLWGCTHELAYDAWESEMRKKMIRDLVLRVAVIVTATFIAVMATGCGSKNTETGSQNENVKNEIVSEQNETVKSVEILGPVEANADKTIELNTKLNGL